MARGSKRQRKKTEKKTLQRQVKSYNRVQYSDAEIEKLSYSSLKSIAQKEQKRQQAAAKKKQSRDALRRRKVDLIIQNGGTIEGTSLRKIDSVKLADLENKNFNRHNYKDFFEDAIPADFDYDKIYKLPDGKRMYFAYRDFAGEQDFQDLISDYSSMSNTQLMQRLEGINAVPLTGHGKGKKRIGSSGAAGDYKFLVADQKTITAFHQDRNKKPSGRKSKKRKEHTGGFKGFQVLKNGRLNSFDTVTPRNLLIVANAIMYNVTEQERKNFYKRFYAEVNKNIPEFGKILPKP